MIVFGVFVEAGGVCLKQGSHLVDKRAGTAGTDAVHTLLHIAAFKINDFRVLAAQLNGYIRLGSGLLQGCRYRYNLLNKGYAQMVRQGQSAGAGDGRIDGQIAKLSLCFFKK